MHTSDTLLMRGAHVSEARTLATLSRLHVEYGLRWRWTPARVRASIKDRETMVLLGTIEGDIVGFAIMRFGDSDAHLHLLAVSPERRRHGIGRALIQWLETSCRTAGMQRIRVEVRERNDIACAFYERLEFRREGRIAGYYDGREAALVYCKSLSRAEISPS